MTLADLLLLLLQVQYGCMTLAGQSGVVVVGVERTRRRCGFVTPETGIDTLKYLQL
jgi:hypothetical protein